jgi:ABC-type oligopeptide transport system substrate-binding subunit
MNVTVKPFDDPLVRQAIAYSIDRQQFVSAQACKQPPTTTRAIAVSSLPGLAV